MSKDRSGELPTERSAHPILADAESYAITVIQGPDTGATCMISPSAAGRIIVGTSPICTLRVTDREVSRRHFALRAEEKALVIMDLGSTNGTFVNGVAIREAILR